MIDSLTIEDSSSFVESVLHCDTTQDEKKSAIPGSTFTYIMNVLGETPFDVGSVARQHNKAKSNSLTIEDSSSFVESVLHCDTAQDEKKSAIPGSTFTYIMNVLGETPFDVGSVARQHNKWQEAPIFLSAAW
jgi:hypothetical protein